MTHGFRRYSVLSVINALMVLLTTVACASHSSTTVRSASSSSNTLTRRDPNVSFDDAKLILQRAESLAEAGDDHALCGMGGSIGICRDFLQDVGGVRTAPTVRPTIATARVLQNIFCGSQPVSIGGMVLVLKGQDATGNAYSSEFMVMRWRGNLVPYNPVYWSGMRMSAPAINCQSGGTSDTTSGTPATP